MESQSIKQDSSHPHLTKTQPDRAESDLHNSSRGVEWLTSHVESLIHCKKSHSECVVLKG